MSPAWGIAGAWPPRALHYLGRIKQMDPNACRFALLENVIDLSIYPTLSELDMV